MINRVFFTLIPLLLSLPLCCSFADGNVAVSAIIDRWYPTAVTAALSDFEDQFYLFGPKTSPFMDTYDGSAGMTLSQGVAACESIGGALLYTRNHQMWPVGSLNAYPWKKDTNANTRFWFNLYRSGFGTAQDTVAAASAESLESPITAASLSPLYSVAPTALSHEGKYCFTMKDFPVAASARLVPVACSNDTQKSSSFRALVVCQRPFRKLASTPPSSFALRKDTRRWVAAPKTSGMGAQQIIALGVTAPTLGEAAEMCAANGAVVALVPTSEYAEQVVAPVIQRVHGIPYTSSTLYYYNCTCPVNTQVNGAKATFLDWFKIGSGGVVPAQFGASPICQGGCSPTNTFAYLTVSNATGKLVATTRSTVATEAYVLCARPVVNISLSLGLTEVSVGAVVPLTITLTSLPASGETVWLAIRARTTPDATAEADMAYTVRPLVFLNETTGASVTTAVLIPPKAATVITEVVLSVTLLSPSGGEVDREAMSWATSNRIRIRTPALSLYTVTLSSTALTMRTGEIATLTATLNRPFTQDMFLVQSKGSNYVEMPAAVFFLAGEITKTVTVKAVSSTEGRAETIALIPIANNTDRVINHTQEVTLSATVEAPYTFTWSSTLFEIVDGGTAIGTATISLDLNAATAPSASTIRVLLSSNCSSMVTLTTDVFSFTGSTVRQTVQATVPRIYHDTIYCSLNGTVDSSFQGAVNPDAVMIVIRRRSRMIVERLVTTYEIGLEENVSTVLRLDRWVGPSNGRMDVSIVLSGGASGSACSDELRYKPTVWSYTEDASTWVARFELEKISGTTNTTQECTQAISLSWNNNPTRRSFFTAATDLPQLLPIMVQNSRNYPSAQVNLLDFDGDYRRVVEGVDLQFRLAYSKAAHTLQSISYLCMKTDASGNYADNVNFASTEGGAVSLVDGSPTITLSGRQFTSSGQRTFKVCPCYSHSSAYRCFTSTIKTYTVLNVLAKPNPSLQFRIATTTGSSAASVERRFIGTTPLTTLPAKMPKGTVVRVEIMPTMDVVKGNTIGNEIYFSILSSWQGVVLSASSPVAILDLRTSQPLVFFEFSISAASSTYAFTLRSSPVSTSVVPYVSGNILVVSDVAPGAPTWASTGAFNGSPFNNFFCHRLSFAASGSQTLETNISVTKSHALDDIVITSGAVALFTNTATNHDVCVHVRAMKTPGSFDLSADTWRESGLLMSSNGNVATRFTATQPARFVQVYSANHWPSLEDGLPNLPASANIVAGSEAVFQLPAAGTRLLNATVMIRVFGEPLIGNAFVAYRSFTESFTRQVLTASPTNVTVPSVNTSARRLLVHMTLNLNDGRPDAQRLFHTNVRVAVGGNSPSYSVPSPFANTPSLYIAHKDVLDECAVAPAALSTPLFFENALQQVPTAALMAYRSIFSATMSARLVQLGQTAPAVQINQSSSIIPLEAGATAAALPPVPFTMFTSPIADGDPFLRPGLQRSIEFEYLNTTSHVLGTCALRDVWIMRAPSVAPWTLESSMYVGTTQLFNVTVAPAPAPLLDALPLLSANSSAKIILQLRAFGSGSGNIVLSPSSIDLSSLSSPLATVTTVTISSVANIPANFQLEATFVPRTAHYRDYVFDRNISLIALKEFDISLQSANETILYGCSDFLPASAAILFATLTSGQNISATMTQNFTAGSPTVVFAYNESAEASWQAANQSTPFSLSASEIALTDTSPTTVAFFFRASCWAAGNGSFVAGGGATALLSFSRGGTEQLAFLTPKPILVVLRTQAWIDVSAPTNVFMGLSNAVEVSIVLERVPKSGRQLVLTVRCLKNVSGEYLPSNELAPGECTVSASTITFSMTHNHVGGNYSATKITWWVSVEGTFLLEFKYAAINGSTAVEFGPSFAQNITRSFQSRLPFFIETYRNLVYIPSGKSGYLYMRNNYYGMSVYNGVSITMKFTANVSTSIVTFQRSSPYTTTMNSRDFSQDGISYWYSGVNGQTVATITPLRLSVDLSFTSPEFSTVTTPAFIEAFVFPPHSVVIENKNPNYYSGTQGGQNIVCLRIPRPYNLPLLNTTDPIFEYLWETSSSAVTVNGTIGPRSFMINASNLNPCFSIEYSGTQSSFQVYGNVRNCVLQATLYAFEYDSVSCARSTLTFTVYSLASASLDAFQTKWYVGDLFQARILLPAADVTRCMHWTNVIAQSESPTATFTINRDNTTMVRADQTEGIFSGLLGPSSVGLQYFRFWLRGTCHNFFRTNSTTMYNVYTPTPVLVTGFPDVVYIGAAVTFSITLRAEALNDVNTTATTWWLTWTGLPAACELSLVSATLLPTTFVAAGNESLALQGMYNVTTPKSLLVTLQISLRAISAQSVPATITNRFLEPRNRNFGNFSFLGTGTMIIPPLRSFTLNTTMASLQRILLGTNNSNDLLFFGENTCLTVSRPSQPTYGTTVDVNLVVDSTFLITSSSGSLEVTPFSKTYCLSVQSVLETLATPLTFIVVQSNNLYLPLANRTVRIAKAARVSILYGPPTAMFCGSGNAKVLTLVPTGPPLRDPTNITFEFYVNGVFHVSKVASWQRGELANKSFSISFDCLVIPPGASTANISVLQIYSGNDMVPITASERAFWFTISVPTGIRITGIRKYVFTQQTMIAVITPFKAPVQFPLTARVVYNVTGAGSASEVYAEAEVSSLRWNVGDRSQRNVELFGNKATPNNLDGSQKFHPLVLVVDPNPEFDTQNIVCDNDCEFAVVQSAEFSRSVEEVIVFIGHPQTFTLTQKTCAPGATIDASLTPFEYASAMRLVPDRFNFTCDPSRPLSYTIEVVGLSPANSDPLTDPTPRPTGLLIYSTMRLVGAADFFRISTPSPDLRLVVRRPASIVATVSSGAFLFFGRGANLTISIPRRPSRDNISISVTTNDGNTSVGAALVWTAVALDAPLTQHIAIILNDPPLVGTTVLNVTVTGPASTEFYLAGIIGRSSQLISLSRVRPFRIMGSFQGAATEVFFVGISYNVQFSLEQPPSRTTSVNLTLSLRRSVDGVIGFRSPMYSFAENQTSMMIPFLVPVLFPGTYYFDAVVSASAVYETHAQFDRSNVSLRLPLQITVTSPPEQQYVGQQNVQIRDVVIPPLASSAYRVKLTADWNNDVPTCRTACIAFLQEDTFNFDASRASTPRSTRLSFYCTQAQTCTLLLKVDGSDHFDHTTIRAGVIKYLPLIQLAIPATLQYTVLVGTTVYLAVNVTALPPPDTNFTINAVSRAGLTVFPTEHDVTSSSTTGTGYIFSVKITAVGALTIPFTCVPRGAQKNAFDTTKQVEIQITSEPLLRPELSAGSTILIPQTLSPSTSSVIELFPTDLNKIALNFTLSKFFRFNRPASGELQFGVSSNSSFFDIQFENVPDGITSIPVGGGQSTKAFAASASAVVIKENNEMPLRLRLKLVAQNPTAPVISAFFIRLAKSDSSTTGSSSSSSSSSGGLISEYDPELIFAVKVMPLFEARFVSPATMFEGAENSVTISVSTTGFPVTPVGSRPAVLTVTVGSSCGYIVFEPNRLTFSVSATQVVRVIAKGSGACDIIVQQPSTSSTSTGTGSVVVPTFSLQPRVAPLAITAQARLSMLLVIDDRAVTVVSASHIRTKGLTFRLISSGAAWNPAVGGFVISPMNDSTTEGLQIVSTSPLAAFGLPAADGITYTGFWRSIAGLLQIPLQADGAPTVTFEEMQSVFRLNANTSAIRWSIHEQQRSVDISIAPMPGYKSNRDETIIVRALNTAFEQHSYPKPGEDRVTITILADYYAKQGLVQEADTSAMLFASSIISGLLSFHSAVEGSKIAAVVAFARCPHDSWIASQQNMDVFMFPLRKMLPFLELGADEELGMYAGAIIGNGILVALWTGIHFLIVYGAHRMNFFRNVEDFTEVQSLLVFPGLVWFPTLIIYVPTMISAVRVLFYSPHAGYKVLAAAAMAVFIFIIPAIGLRIIAQARQLEYKDPKRKNTFQWLFEEGVYDHPSDPDWIGRFGAVITPMRGDARWFFFADLLALVGISFTIGVNPTSTSHCLTRNIFVCVFFVIIFLTFVLLQPFSRKIDNIFFAIVSALEVTAIVMMTAQVEIENREAANAISNAASAGGGSGTGDASSNTASSISTTAPPINLGSGGSSSSSSSGTSSSSSGSGTLLLSSGSLETGVSRLLIVIAALLIVRGVFQLVLGIRRLCGSLEQPNRVQVSMALTNEDPRTTHRREREEKRNRVTQQQKDNLDNFYFAPNVTLGELDLAGDDDYDDDGNNKNGTEMTSRRKILPEQRSRGPSTTFSSAATKNDHQYSGSNNGGSGALLHDDFVDEDILGPVGALANGGANKIRRGASSPTEQYDTNNAQNRRFGASPSSHQQNHHNQNGKGSSFNLFEDGDGRSSGLVSMQQLLLHEGTVDYDDDDDDNVAYGGGGGGGVYHSPPSSQRRSQGIHHHHDHHRNRASHREEFSSHTHSLMRPASMRQQSPSPPPPRLNHSGGGSANDFEGFYEYGMEDFQRQETDYRRGWRQDQDTEQANAPQRARSSPTGRQQAFASSTRNTSGFLI